MIGMKLKVDLAQLASHAMVERGLEPEFSKEVLQQANQIKNPASFASVNTDLRALLWCSIDNDDSRDLDQLTYAEKVSEEETIIYVAVADVDALVKKNTPIDLHAQLNTTSVYTPAKIFTMLPEELSTNLTSLNENEDRLSVVVKMSVNQTGEIANTSIFQASVHNYAQLTYDSVGRWLEGKSGPPEKVSQLIGLEDSLRAQHEIAQILRKKRYSAGSLSLESSEAEVKILNDDQIVVKLSAHNLAQQLIEEFMIAANTTMAQHLKNAKLASLRRVVKVPKSWDRIVELAQSVGGDLPPQPDSKALDSFLVARRKTDPDSFPDLSLAVIKLLGRGEYVVENVDGQSSGHFALALREYTHSTAPNRRYPDLISQRQYKAFLRGESPPYLFEELTQLAIHCTQQEDAAMKVERQVNKSAAAALLSSQLGTVFKGIVTGIGEKGTWVRIFQPAVEGKIVRGFEKLRVGDKISVQLKSVNILKGFIDFVAARG
jgi:exoribonuclease-2